MSQLIFLDLVQSLKDPGNVQLNESNCKSFKKLDGSIVCGFLIEGIYNWTEAAEQCKAKGARLPEIKGLEDNEYFLELKVCKEYV
jgi:hypothetical protein